MPATDLYDILEVSPDADDADLRRAYQRQARRFHPDLHPGDRRARERYAEVSRAFEILSNPELRRRYDRLRDSEGPRAASWIARWSESEEVLAGGGGTWVRTSRRVEVRAGDVARDALPTDTARVEVSLDFAEMVHGTSRSFPLQREAVCDDCEGTGSRDRRSCERCAGRGQVIELERVRVRIPRGVEDGARLRLAGKGAPLAPGRQGDLEIVVRVTPHAYFRRQGADIHADLPLTLAEAALGAQVQVPTLGGPVTVKIAAGTQGGQRIRLRGRGITPSGGEPGDHYCRVTIAVPSASDPAVRELLQSVEQEDPRAGLPRSLEPRR